MIIKAIETNYKGYKFRSRLEARWAVYFDSIGLKWDYEVEGFKLENGKYYLPDFYIPNFGYIEIKALGKVTKEEIEKCRLLSKQTGEVDEFVALFEGSPDSKAYMCFISGNETCAITFSKYTVRKWDQTPAWTALSHLEESDFFYEEDKSIEKARSFRF